MLTDQEIIELEQLLKIEELNVLPDEVNDNYRFLKKQYEEQTYVNENLVKGSKGVVLEGGARCFCPNQLVNTISGPKRISELKIGELVHSFNHTSKQLEYKKVLDKIPQKNIKRCYEIKMKDGSIIRCTEDHRFYYKGEYIEIKNILNL